MLINVAFFLFGVAIGMTALMVYINASMPKTGKIENVRFGRRL